MTADHAFDRLVSANPVPDVERYIADMMDLEDSLEEFDVVVTRRTPVTATPGRAPRVLFAAAVFAAVVLAAVALTFAALRGGGDAVSNDPREVVTTFFERWNAGDVDEALQLVEPDVLVNGGMQRFADLRSLMVFASQFDGRMEAECSATELAGSISCSWRWTAASAEAMGLEGAEARRFQVVDGRIVALATPSYGPHEAAISAFAESSDPSGYAEACDPEGATTLSAYGFPFNADCGAFLAGLEQAFIESLGS